MEETIIRLLDILNRYPISEVNRMYRDREVELEVESFTKYPDVRWSDHMKKKMLQDAKRKKISPGRIKYLESQITELNNYAQKTHVNNAGEDVITMISKWQSLGISSSEICLLHIEFSDWYPEANIQVYGNYKKEKYENEIAIFTCSFSSAKYWNELDSSKFSSMSEKLEILEIEEEEYPQIFVQIRELRVFQALKKAMNQATIKKQLHQILPNAKIEIGIHDNDYFVVYDGVSTTQKS